MNEYETREPSQAMIAQKGRGNILQECSPPRAINAGESDSRSRTPCSSLWVSSSVPGTKNRHAVFFSVNNIPHLDVLRGIVKTYRLPYLQMYVYESRIYFACFKPVTKERYRKILKAISKKSLSDFDKHGHVLHPVFAHRAPVLDGEVEDTTISKSHYTMWKNIQPVFTNAIMVGDGPGKIFVRKENNRG